MIDLEGLSDLLQTSPAEYSDPVRHGHRFRLVVRHINHGDPDLAVDALDLALHLLT